MYWIVIGYLESLRRGLLRIGDILVAFWYLVLLLILSAIGLSVASAYVPSPFLESGSQILNYFTMFAAAGSVVSSAYLRIRRAQETKALKETADSEIDALSIRVTDTIHQYVSKFAGFPEAEIESMKRKYWPIIRDKLGQVSGEIRYDITNYLFDKATALLSLQTGQRYFLMRKYFDRNQIGMVQRLTDSLNKSKFMDEKSPEYTYLRLLKLSAEYPNLELSDLMGRVPTVTPEEVAEAGTIEQGHEAIYKVVREIVKDRTTETRYTNLKRIVQRLILETHVSEAGLLSLTEHENDLVFVMKSEAGVGGLKTVFKKGKEITPFKKVLLSHGFVQVGLASAGSFVIPATKIPKEYRSQVPLYMEKAIIPEVDQEWTRLQSQWGKFKRLKRKTYSYIAFRVRRPELKTSEVGTKLRPAVSEMLSPMDVDETTGLLASHIYEIPTVLAKMELDSIVDTGTENMKNALRIADESIRKKLSESGTSIKDVSDFRNVIAAELAFLILNLGNPILDAIAPRARKFNEENSRKLAEEAVKNAADLYNITRRLATAV